jgi:hypothetical protein
MVAIRSAVDCVRSAQIPRPIRIRAKVSRIVKASIHDQRPLNPNQIGPNTNAALFTVQTNLQLSPMA